MALNSQLTTSFVFVILMSFSCYSNAHTFYVGGDEGWSLHPSENYNHWSDRYRFSINDELVFRYKKGHDSVLVVNQNDYTRCNKESPIRALKKGDDESRFILENSGPFFFISGHNQNCEKGQKLKLNVLSPRHHHKINYTAPSQPPQIPLQPLFSSAPSPANIAPTPAPVINHSPTPSPAANAPSNVSPVMSPSPSPAAEAPSNVSPEKSPSPSPAAEAPSNVSPVIPPSPSPAPSNPNLLNSHSLTFSSGTKTQTHAPPSHSPSPSPSPATRTWSSPIEPPSPSPSPSPTMKNPTHAPPSHSPRPSPVVRIQTHAPPPRVQPLSQSPSPKAESPIENSGAAQINHHHAPAPAPSAASYSGVSLAPLFTGLSLVAIIISVV